ncbi:MAG TPA: UDP-N-acetylmuramoyl-L-alanyl-D-glutamate--2,6-diaminopimelate ligase [Candidatus Limnocylindrales bacterium]|nr:UDP-N-acetylmuramoyl-L-alanyl-D-glutamate--2,6-diaminopimelate ligase [Candidatus Limnocylindrales bacterium]
MTDVASMSELLAAAEPREQRRLGDLLERLTATGGAVGARDGGRAIGPAALAALQLRGVTDDTRRLRPGALFVAIHGEHVDGHDLLRDAEAGGAVATIVERPVPDSLLPQVVVGSTRAALADAAAWWYGDPSRALGVVGITGTDGKTTTSYLAVAALEAAGLSSGLVGTVETKIGGLREAHAEHLTTPGAPDLQHALRAMVDAGNRAAVVETTSHGLATDRVRAIAYDVAILTNLTHEHLEFHGTWEAYRDAKLSLFERLAAAPRGAGVTKESPAPHWPRTAIVNADDPNAGAFVGVAQEAGAAIVTYGADDAADVRLTRVEEDGRRLRVSYEGRAGAGSLELRIAGRFNAYNALAVVALGSGLGLDAQAVRAGLESVEAVPGRMESIDAGQPFGVVVDFAHSPASLQAVLDVLAPVAAARGGGLVALFGSAGERDTAKRPMMGRIAGERCRLVVVTDEDPRREDREAILEDIAVGAEDAGRRRGRDLLLIADRPAAIAAAFERARPGDIVLLAGKGHEASIIGPAGPQPYDERATARQALAALGYEGS